MAAALLRLVSAKRSSLQQPALLVTRGHCLCAIGGDLGPGGAGQRYSVDERPLFCRKACTVVEHTLACYWFVMTSDHRSSVLPGAVTETTVSIMQRSSGGHEMPYPVRVRGFELDLLRAPEPRWFVLAQAFGLTSRDFYPVADVASGAQDTQCSDAVLYGDSASAWGPACAVLRDPNQFGSPLSATADGQILRAEPSEQAAAWLDFGLRARQGERLGDRWDTALSSPVVERLARSLASSDEHQEAAAFLRALMARYPDAPSTIKVALLQKGPLRDSLPEDVRAWVEA